MIDKFCTCAVVAITPFEETEEVTDLPGNFCHPESFNFSIKVFFQTLSEVE